jgi:L,D-transpeptidase ErfK/SrfK
MMRPQSRQTAVLFVCCCLLMVLPGLTAEIKAQAQAQAQAQAVYPEVHHNQEEYVVKKGDRLPSIAQRRALRLQVLSKMNLPKQLKPGCTLNLSYVIIPPREVTDGLVVNLAELAVYHFQNGAFLRRFPLAAGIRGWETPTGNFKILNKVKNPTWHVPESIQWEMYDRGQEVITEVPPGPKNPLGSYWMATSAPGVGFHATTSPWSVGRYASHGCFRMLTDQIEELFNQIEVGTPVKIIYKPLKLAVTPDNRIFLEVHGDYYQRVPNFFQAVQTLAKNQQLENRIDWQRVKQALKDRDGVALEITKSTEPVSADSHLGTRLYSGEIVRQAPEAASPSAQAAVPRKKPQAGL